MSEDEIAELREALGAVLGTHAGKRVIFWLLSQCGVYQEAFTPDAAATAYMLGRQSIGRILIAQMDAIDPRHYPRLLLEIADMRAMAEAAKPQEKSENDDDLE